MFATNREPPCGATAATRPPRPKPAGYKLARDIDLDRVVWDQEYREEVRLYLRSGAD